MKNNVIGQFKGLKSRDASPGISVISAYPESRKVPDAYLKIGFSYYEIKDWVKAQSSLEKVLTDFSSSTAARLAERRLQKMKLEGHI